MSLIAGTRGYERDVDQFVAASQALDFSETNADFIPFLPAVPADVLDAGSGAGQNAAALAGMGYGVVAAEPMPDFLAASRSSYVDLDIEWVQDSLPLLDLIAHPGFDFILMDGVWHHLSLEERMVAMRRVADLLRPGGRCAISLRNGPPGMGSHLYPTDSEVTVQYAEALQLSCVLHLKNQPSILKNKEGVRWSRIVLEKPERA